MFDIKNFTASFPQEQQPLNENEELVGRLNDLENENEFLDRASVTNNYLWRN